MVELKDSARIEPKKENRAEIDKEVSSVNSYYSCAKNLDENRLRDILENIPSGVMVLEKPYGKVTYANKRAIKLHGLNPCGIELNKQPSKLKIFTLDGKVCPIEELYSYKALIKEETLRN